ncbi:hypothetical protein TBLA_0J00360 [Henningerozyma blattae CBS 6284]|uniref:DSC E3 ubiquitin ligase complex subunit 3 C-terminal domain-containing protein n=1 Tax=Henningerozyma blattae (strain ATCC 34711 / CBS 6284 / DSM 70876 / NBRC 10599 / NRRL Y-10934 / UCD 77-7) TaxID=1071380 RepID=I2H9I4_HENB6|nr:hypothetical protein TBLA_0J00360 [Tetrapisispora blattae CBS 6284]CCH63036.1 hypothetical protein TBLA_0J00360 [Tetrapisispora blattae CBS 6284]
MVQQIVIRFSDDHISDLVLDVTNINFNIINTKWLRRICRDRRPDVTKNRRLRFIRAGGLLNSNSDLSRQLTSFFNTTRSNSQDQNQPSNTNNGNIPDESLLGERATSSTEEQFFIHCTVGAEPLSASELENEDTLDDAGPSSDGITTQAVGFDRLQSLGFSEEEIELIRNQFRETYGDLEDNANHNEGNNSQGNGNRETDIRQLEEQWMNQGTSNGTDAMGNPINTEDDRFNSVPIANYKQNRDLLIGLCIGLSLGLFALLLLRYEGLFNTRQKMAIWAGVIGNIVFSFARGF